MGGSSRNPTLKKLTIAGSVDPATSLDLRQGDGQSSPPKYQLKDRERSPPKQVQEGRMSEYRGDEETIVCKRFPHKKFCACDNKCYEADTNIVFQPTQVRQNLL